MKKSQHKHILTDLQAIREKGTYSSTNLIRGSMLEEMYNIFLEYLGNDDKKYLKDRVMVDNIIHKNSFYNRENVWRIFDQRYLSCPSWIIQSIANSTRNGKYSPDFLSLSYLFFVFRERLVHDIVVKLVWERWQNKNTSIESVDVQEYIKSVEKEIPIINQWSELTIRRSSQSILSALRDFGILKGKVNKSIQRPSISLEAAYYLLCILIAEGNEGKAIIMAKDWRLFLWSEMDVIDALNKMAMKKWIQFERSGPTTILELVRLPGVES